MSAGRRIAKVEGALSPKAATLLWLSDTRAFGTLDAYVGWLIDQPPAAAPLARIPQAVESGVRAAMRGEKRDAIERSVREAVRQAVFLVELVITLNLAAEESVRMERLRYAALFWEMRAISAVAQLESAGAVPATRAALTARWAAWHATVSSLIGRLYLTEEARERLERRYPDGAPTLFPELAGECQALREQVERLAGLGSVVSVATPRVDGARRRSEPSRRLAINLRQVRVAALDRATEEATSLVDTARAAALDALGDTDGAGAIAELRLRG